MRSWASRRTATQKKAGRMIFVAGVLFLAGCSNLVYLTGHKVLPLGKDTGQKRTPVYCEGNWIVARASLHNHTTLSDGVYTPEDLLELARREGLAILAINDHREGGIKIKHGPRVPVNGIEKIGYPAYFDRLRPLKELAGNQEMLLLIGAEVNPFLYNYGKAPNFVVAYQNRHLVVYGISDPKVFQEMPVWREVSVRRPDFYHDLSDFQTFIDYILAQGGMVTAAHPESQQDDWVGPVHFFDQPPINHARDLKRLTGVAILPEGFHQASGGPGGYWDTALLEYLMGMREQAPWVIGDSDFHGPDESPAWSTTLFYLKQFSEDEVYAAFREGRTVALMGKSFQEVYVSEFSVSEGGKPPVNPIMFARNVTVSGPPVIRFRLNREVPLARTRLIRNGKVILEKEGSSLEYTDAEMFEKKFPAYYRVEVVGPKLPKEEIGLYAEDSELFTNPIFVRL